MPGKLRRELRAKLVRAVESAVAPLREEQNARLDRLERELAGLRKDVNRTFDRLVEFEIRSRHDLVYAGDREAAAESHRFAREHLTGATAFRKPWETLRYALSLAPAGGMALEFGVATGSTLRVIAQAREDTVYGFDSFDGLPEDWVTGMPAGSFATSELPDVPGAELVVGLFDDTLPGFLAAHPGPVDFVHVDSDLYSSARTVLDLVGPRLRPGSVIVFDEFFNYPGWQEHEARAWREYVDKTGIRFSYEAFSYEDRQVVVRITD
ncbi:class I SAM-dependent methyltransferase [Prauserella oleivorans]|uniref:Class I SAM-dependent methyltransferase n=1 Tax=Prauserella oleivorans TaxID=1478153 RepID=A0ABW5WKR8_9PSEU